MARITLETPRPDCLIVHRGRHWPGLLPLGLAFALIVALSLMARGDEPKSLALVLLGGFLLVPAALHAARSLRTSTITLVRTGHRMLMDGEPLELARVELRARQWPLFKQPHGYSLSLWLMTMTGPLDVPLGQYATLVEASGRAGEVEDFVQQVKKSEPHRA